MILDFASITPSQRYLWMTQAVIPRPIAWVLTENKAGDYNLAPFSYFNAVSSDPALIAFSITTNPNGEDKDTLINIRNCPDFTIHIASLDMINAVNQSSAALEYGQSELTALNLETTPINPAIRMPRLKDAPIALACTLHQEVVLSDVQNLILARLNHLYVNDDCMAKDYKGRPKIDAAKVNPLLRLGAGQYATLSDIIPALPITLADSNL